MENERLMTGDQGFAGEMEMEHTKMSRNAESSMKVTDGGRTIDFNPVPSNADLSIRSSRDTPSNMTISRNLHAKKLFLPKTATDDGITIDSNAVLENAKPSTCLS
jgi:hypothetical protein